MEASKGPALTVAGQSLRDWCAAAGIGYSTYFTIPDDRLPRFVKIGKRTLIIEAPGAWLERMAAQGGVPTKRSVPA